MIDDCLQCRWYSRQDFKIRLAREIQGRAGAGPRQLWATPKGPRLGGPMNSTARLLFVFGMKKIVSKCPVGQPSRKGIQTERPGLATQQERKGRNIDNCDRSGPPLRRLRLDHLESGDCPCRCSSAPLPAVHCCYVIFAFSSHKLGSQTRNSKVHMIAQPADIARACDVWVNWRWKRGSVPIDSYMYKCLLEKLLHKYWNILIVSKHIFVFAKNFGPEIVLFVVEIFCSCICPSSPLLRIGLFTTIDLFTQTRKEFYVSDP